MMISRRYQQQQQQQQKVLSHRDAGTPSRR